MSDNEKNTGAVTSGISFSPAYWAMLEAARSKGFSRSRIVTMALDALKIARPDVFLPSDYSAVISGTDEKPATTGADA